MQNENVENHKFQHRCTHTQQRMEHRTSDRPNQITFCWSKSTSLLARSNNHVPASVSTAQLYLSIYPPHSNILHKQSCDECHELGFTIGQSTQANNNEETKSQTKNEAKFRNRITIIHLWDESIYILDFHICCGCKYFGHYCRIYILISSLPLCDFWTEFSIWVHVNVANHFILQISLQCVVSFVIFRNSFDIHRNSFWAVL